MPKISLNSSFLPAFVKEGVAQLVIVLLGVLFLYLSVVKGSESYFLTTQGVRASAIIVDVQEKYNDGKTTYRNVGLFKDNQGDEIRFITEVGTGKPRYEKDSQVEVIYNPKRSSEVKVNSMFDLWFTPGLFFFMGMIMFGVGGFTLCRGFIKRDK